MSKPKSYSITPRDLNKARAIFRASNIVLKNFLDWTKENIKDTDRSKLFARGVDILQDLLEDYQNLYKKVQKLSDENEALKLMWMSVEQERKDQAQNQEYIKRLLKRIQS